MIVCAKHSFDSAEPKPFCYMHLSQDLDYAAIIQSDTWPQWYVEKILDSRYNREQDCYLASLKLATFGRLEDERIQKKRPQDQTNEEWLADWQKRDDEIRAEEKKNEKNKKR